MELTERFDEAVAWASTLHRDQRRKGTGIPYVTHLLSVAALVVEHGGDEDQAIAGLLHDSIEDVGVTDDEIAERLGGRVAAIVRACTDADVHPKPPWLERKRAYIAHLADVPADALVVSLADKVHNARTIAEDVERVCDGYFDVFKGKADGTRWYYRRLADAFGARVADLPPESLDGVSRAGGAGLLAEYERTIERFGATPRAADDFEANIAEWTPGLGAPES